MISAEYLSPYLSLYLPYLSPYLLPISLTSSFIYWYLSVIVRGTSIHLLAPFKLLAVLSLVLISQIDPIIPLLYSLGDVALLYNIDVCMFFFDIAHMMYILPILYTSLNMSYVWLIPVPIIMMFLSTKIMAFFNAEIIEGPVFQVHIFILQLLLLYGIVNNDYYVFCHIVSDILIGIHRFRYLTWPIYYVGMLYITKCF